MYRKRKRGLSVWQKKAMTDDGARIFLDAQARPDRMRGSEWSRNNYGASWRLANEAQRANRMISGFYGRGDYESDVKPWLQRWVPKGALSAAGGWLGGLAGAGGATFGSGVGHLASRWLGWGKYKRQRRSTKNYKGRGDYGGSAGGNQIMGNVTDAPMTVNSDENNLTGDVYFSHREFLGNIFVTGGAGNLSPFAITQYPLNAGLPQTFPWLSQIAQNFTLYELQGCIFEFRPTAGELGMTGTNALGKVVMATQYDPDAPAFTSTIQMENYDYANACKPSEHMAHGIETADKQRATQMLYIRTGATSKDKIFTDFGIFQIATEGLPCTAGTTANIGELWVSYRVKLSRAQLYGSQLGSNIGFDNHLAVSSAANLTANTAAYLASTAYATHYVTQPALTFFPYYKNTIGCVVTQNTVNQSVKIVFPDTISFGVYRISWEITPSAAATISFNNPTYNGNVAAKVYNGVDGQPGASHFSTAIAAAVANVMSITLVAITAAPSSAGNNFVVLSWAAADATNNKLQNITITQCPAL